MELEPLETSEPITAITTEVELSATHSVGVSLRVNFSLATAKLSVNFCMGVFPKHHL